MYHRFEYSRGSLEARFTDTRMFIKKTKTMFFYFQISFLVNETETLQTGELIWSTLDRRLTLISY